MAETERLQDRNERWYRLHAIEGKTLRAIASQEGVTSATVHSAIKQVRDSIPDKSRDETIRDVLEFYAKVRNEAWKIAELTPAPVTAGKDGTVVYDPETGAIVRDYSGRLRAMETAMKTVESERKMLGLDAAVKIEQNVTDQVAADRAAQEAAARLESEEGTE